jgi:hypothetical protein
MELFTNAPPHWPKVTLAGWDARKTWNNAEPVAIALDQGFVAAGTPRPMLLYGSRLADDGVLEVPIQITDRGQKYSVFLLASGSSEWAATFAGAKQFIEADGTALAVYYCPEPLADAAPANPFGPFRTRYIAQYERPAPVGQYAMWWASTGDEVFSSSSTFGLLDAFFRACDGIESYVLREMLNALGLTAGAGAQRTLPNDSLQIPIYGPGEQLMIFGASSKGLRFFFPVASTDPRYRDRFWIHVAEYARRFSSSLQAAGYELESESARRGLPWWNSVPQLLRHVGDPHAMAQFGPLHVTPPT